MDMNAAKADFLKNKFTPYLQQIPSDTPGKWGKMTLQQMVEHFADSVRIASGTSKHRELVTPEENLQRLRDFIFSDKPFRENTPNPLMPVLPPPVRNASINDSIRELQQEINYFFSEFENNKHLITRNPFFGDMNFEENIHLLYKHALHHLKQFGKEI